MHGGLEEDSRSRCLWHIYDKTPTCCADLTRCAVDGDCLNDAVVMLAAATHWLKLVLLTEIFLSIKVCFVCYCSCVSISFNVCAYVCLFSLCCSLKCNVELRFLRA